MHRLPRRVLIVDDDPGVCAELCGLFNLAGYASETAATAEQGFALIDAWRPDLLVLDLAFSPHGSEGLAFCRAVRAGETGCPATIPIIVFSSHTDDASVREIFAAGASRQVGKQEGSSALLSAIQSLLTMEQTTMSLAFDAPFIPSILLVDDQPGYTQRLVDRLERERMAVIPVHSAPDGQDRYTSGQAFDLAIIDWHLGQGRKQQHAGLTLIRWLRERAFHGPIIVLTGMFNEGINIQQAYDAGANCYLSKSDSAERLIAEIRRLLRMPVRPITVEDEDSWTYGITSVKGGVVYINGEEVHGLRSTWVNIIRVLIEHRGEGVSLADISNNTGVVEGSVKAYKSDICKALREQFGEAYGDLIVNWKDLFPDPLTHQTPTGYRLKRQPDKRTRS